MHSQWKDIHQTSLELLIQVLTSPPTLAYPDFTHPFVLHTDASKDGLAAVLYQEDKKGVLRVSGYGSRSLMQAEKSYHMHAGISEFLILKWSICDHFRDYQYYVPNFVVFTDNNPLTYVLSTAKCNAMGYIWIAELADCNLKIRYRPGARNGDADALSRLPLHYQELSSKEASTDTIDALINSIRAEKLGNSIWTTAIKANNNPKHHTVSCDKVTPFSKVTHWRHSYFKPQMLGSCFMNGSGCTSQNLEYCDIVQWIWTSLYYQQSIIR